MLKIFSKILIILFLVFFCGVDQMQAASIAIVPSKSNLGLREQFYVDLLLDPEGQSINGVEGSLSFPKNKISFVRFEGGKSIVNLWIQPPLAKDNLIEFSGIIPNGFAGTIDPFDDRHRLPGIIARFVFETISSGGLDLKTTPIILTINDGMGTVKNIGTQSISLDVYDANNPVLLRNDNDSNPQLEAFIVQDPNLFNNRHTLIFNATDKGSGIKNVIIKEGNRKWEEVRSPYLLKDQTRHSLISLRAVNFSGVSVVIAIEPLPYKNKFGALYSVVAIIILFIVFLYKKIRENRKI